ncbi:MAG TPA: MerR family transcriptional regulator [Candidatus Ventricola gallistercoris]|nr:MerR family transcriptional regulator [Candidatus Ventricola gallistercoris]
MNSFFSIGELSKLQNISRQTLIYYDKIGLFCPAYTDPNNGYRYYSASQLDYLDTILILKQIGFSLEEIKAHMAHYTIEKSIVALRKQLAVVTRQIEELQMIKSRIRHRCAQMEYSVAVKDKGEEVTVERVERQFILLEEVRPPHTLEDVSLATKQCFVRAFREHLPIYFQSGAIVPYERIVQGAYTQAEYAFLPIGKSASGVASVRELPSGRCVCTHHIGDYASIGKAYARILAYCEKNRIQIMSDSYEFALNDYLSTGDEREYLTKILFYIG